HGAVLVGGGGVVHPGALRGEGAGLGGQALRGAGLADGTGGFIAAPAALASGEVAALAGVRDGDLVAASSDLDTFASTLIGEVNRIQTNAGAGAVDLVGGSTAPVPLFGGCDAWSITDLHTGAGDGRMI